MRLREYRQLIRFFVCSGTFVLLVAAKLLLPDRMAQVNAGLSRALRQNMDVQAVFSAVGRAFSGEDTARQTADEVYQAVFHPGENRGSTSEMAPMSAVDVSASLDTLHQYRTESQEIDLKENLPDKTEAGIQTPEQISTLAYVLYSNQNLPENVSLEQAILNFDYCTPVEGVLSSAFGYREHPVEGEGRFHYGVDLAADTGTEIVSFADGTVTVVGESSSYGKYCMIAHEGGYSTLYAHCSRITVASGAAVKEGEKIAEVGETGIATGPHLHFEMQNDGVYLNPVYYVSSL